PSKSKPSRSNGIEFLPPVIPHVCVEWGSERLEILHGYFAAGLTGPEGESEVSGKKAGLLVARNTPARGRRYGKIGRAVDFFSSGKRPGDASSRSSTLMGTKIAFQSAHLIAHRDA